jgi:hypothetical protein
MFYLIFSKNNILKNKRKKMFKTFKPNKWEYQIFIKAIKTHTSSSFYLMKLKINIRRSMIEPMKTKKAFIQKNIHFLLWRKK